MPFDRERDRSAAQNAEVLGMVRVLPDGLAGKDQVLSEGLLQPGVEFVSPPGTERGCSRGGTGKQWVQNRIGTANTGKHQVFIERSFQNSRIRGPKNGVGLLEVVGNPHAGLGFSMGSQTIV